MKMTFNLADTQQWNGTSIRRDSVRISGYQGIWFTLGFQFEYGDKYSGGLGTYTANHQPMAVYSPAANKTFFTYGGTSAPDKRELVIMVSYFDHLTGEVPQPVGLYMDPTVDDPHDNASLQVDLEGYVWVFKSGRGDRRPGLIFRSVRPYEIDAFDLMDVQEFTYPQIRVDESGGFFMLFTKYTAQSDRGPARQLFWKTSADRLKWSEDSALACFEGHYQTSGQCGNKIATFFNWHPGSNVDARTNLYYAQTLDGGKTWTDAAGKLLSLPLRGPNHPARVKDYQSRGKNMYTCDLNFDEAGNPVLLYITSRAGVPGPEGDDREWTLLHWKDGNWQERVITRSDHNYDMGSLYINGKIWKVIGPTLLGPQKYGTGGEMALWVSEDEGETWRQEREITSGSSFNHSYARRPDAASDPFFAFWADGNPESMSESRLYFTDQSGSRVCKLPYKMSSATEKVFS
jgi:hypothetical protein